MTQRGRIQLQDGRWARIVSIRQWEFYEGLLEGRPTREMNAEGVDRILAEARAADGAGEPYLIRPQERLDEEDRERPYPFGTPARLPPIVCVARLHSTRTARDRRKDYSELTVIWFQEDYAFPIELGVLEAIRGIDWDQHAVDEEW